MRSNNWFLCLPFHVECWGTNQLVTGSVFYFIYSKMRQINFFWTKLLNDAQLSADLPFFFVWFCSLKEKKLYWFLLVTYFQFFIFHVDVGEQFRWQPSFYCNSLHHNKLVWTMQATEYLQLMIQAVRNVARTFQKTVLRKMCTWWVKNCVSITQ